MSKLPLSARAPLLGPLLVVLAHLLAVAAIASFTLRVGQAPLAETRVYLAAVILSAAAVVTAWRRGPEDGLSAAWAAATVLPLLAVLVLYVSYGGPYAPWDPHDADLVSVWYGTVAAAVAAGSVVAGSWRLFAIGLVGQAVLVLGLLPGALWEAGRYGLGNLASEQVLAPVVVCYVVGAGALWLRRTLGSPGTRATLAGTSVLAIAACLLLAYAVVGLPPNGTDLAHHASGWSVPMDAWDWLRPAAIAGSVLGAILIFGLLLHQLGAAWIARRGAPGMPIAPAPPH